MDDRKRFSTHMYVHEQEAWTRFAAAALPHYQGDYAVEESARLAADDADALLAEYFARARPGMNKT